MRVFFVRVNCDIAHDQVTVIGCVLTLQWLLVSFTECLATLKGRDSLDSVQRCGVFNMNTHFFLILYGTFSFEIYKTKLNISQKLKKINEMIAKNKKEKHQVYLTNKINGFIDFTNFHFKNKIKYVFLYYISLLRYLFVLTFIKRIYQNNSNHVIFE